MLSFLRYVCSAFWIQKSISESNGFILNSMKLKIDSDQELLSIIIMHVVHITNIRYIRP